MRRVKIPARRKAGLESAARSARYAALAGARADFVALAHQLDDQAETVLLNLLRGAGLRGAAAMPEVGPLPLNDDTPLRALRPLLKVPRKAILAYAIAHRLHWDEDESNADESLSRNWVRRRVGPLLAVRYPRWRESLARAAMHFGEAGELLKAGVPERLSARMLRAAPKARAKLLLREFLRAGGARAPDARRLDEMLRQVLEAPADAKLELEHDGRVLRRYRDELALLPAVAAPGEVVFHASVGAGIDAARMRAQAVTVRLRAGRGANATGRQPAQPDAEEPFPGSRRPALGARPPAAPVLRRGPGVGAGPRNRRRIPCRKGARGPRAGVEPKHAGLIASHCFYESPGGPC